MDNVAIKISDIDAFVLEHNIKYAETIADKEGFIGIHNPKVIDCGSFCRLYFEYERIKNE